MEFLFAAVLLAAVAAFVAVPLRRPRVGGGPDPLLTELADLESRKQAKYREIRDTELDHASGKLTDEEFERQEAELRADAIAILKRIDEIERDRGGGRPDAQRSGAPSIEAPKMARPWKPFSG